MTVKQVREFDPQTLDVTRACKFLGLPPRRFDSLATQPDARGRWVGSVAQQRKDLIETFPDASKDMKEMLEAIRKFALRKCLKPDSPARVRGGTAESNARSWTWAVNPRNLLIGSVVAATLLISGTLVLLMPTRGQPQAEPNTGPRTPAEQVVKLNIDRELASVKPPDPMPNPDPVAPPSPGPVYRLNLADIEQVGTYTMRGMRVPPMRGRYPEMPAGVLLACYDKASAGDFFVGDFDCAPMVGLASRTGLASAQLVLELESKLGVSLEPGRGYELRLTYRTEGAVQGWMIAQSQRTYVTAASTALRPTAGRWEGARISFQRAADTPLQLVVRTDLAPEGAMLYVRAAELVTAP